RARPSPRATTAGDRAPKRRCRKRFALRRAEPRGAFPRQGRMRCPGTPRACCESSSEVAMITQVDITLAVPSDAMAIAELSRDAIEYGLSWRWTTRRVARSIRDSATNVIVARQRSRFIGFAIMKYEEEEAHLLLLAVPTAQRRLGVGSA